MTSFRDFISPRFYLEINGKSAADLFPYLNSFDYKDNEKKADELTLTFSNKGLLWQDDQRFRKGVKIKTRWGYPGNMSDVKTMVVTGLEFNMPTEPPSIKMIAQDKARNDLSIKKKETQSKPKSYDFKSSSDIAKAIAQQYGLKADVTDSKDARKEFRVKSAQMSDTEYLAGLAKQLHWDAYVEDGTLHFHPKRLDAVPQHGFRYYTDLTGTLIEFSVDLDDKKKKKKDKTGTIGVDPRTGTPTGIAPATKEGRAIIKMSSGGIYMEPKAFYRGSPETNSGVIEKHARAKHDEGEMNQLKANVTVVGTPTLRSRRMVRIEGVGKTYSGAWRITEVTHSIQSSGAVYVTKCDLKRPKAGEGKKDKNPQADKTSEGVKPEGPKRVTILMGRGAAVWPGGKR